MQKKNVLLIALVLGVVPTFSVQASITLKQEGEDQKASSSIYVASSSKGNSSSSLSNNLDNAVPSRSDTFPELRGMHEGTSDDLSPMRSSTFLGRKKRARSLGVLGDFVESRHYGSYVSSECDADEGVFPDHISEPASGDHHISDDTTYFDADDARSFLSESWQVFTGGEGEQRSSAIRLSRVSVLDGRAEAQVETPVDGVTEQSLMLEMALAGLRKLKFQKNDILERRHTF